MAFATRTPTRTSTSSTSTSSSGVGDPDEFDQGTRRDGFGGDLFRYNRPMTAYDPVSGEARRALPGAALDAAPPRRAGCATSASTASAIDSVDNVASWDFVGDFKDHAPRGAGANVPAPRA